MSTKDTPPPSSIANRVIQPRFGELMQACRQMAMNRLAELLGNVFSQIDDTLFECAEKAENNQVQALFFDAMRQIRKERPALERFYHQRIAQGLSDFLAVLGAEHSLYASEDALAASEARQASELVSLYKSLGGGWEVEDARQHPGGNVVPVVQPSADGPPRP